MFRRLKEKTYWVKGETGDCFQSKHVLGRVLQTTDIIQAVMQC